MEETGRLNEISIHAPHARSDQAEAAERERAHQISIHAPHARSDDEHKVQWVCTQISIHAPHARSDSSRNTSRAKQLYFNPRSSCEERQHASPAKSYSI